MTLGALTVYIIGFNGLMLGGMAALFTNAGFGKDFWATIAPHGVIELTAIQIAGAAGLLIAAGALYPGRRRRRDVIVANARRAGTLIFGVASMLVVAGTIEAFVSPRRCRFRCGSRSVCSPRSCSILYFTGAGRRDRRRYNRPRRLTRRYSSIKVVVSALGRHVDYDDPGTLQHRLGECGVRSPSPSATLARYAVAGIMRLLA